MQDVIVGMFLLGKCSCQINSEASLLVTCLRYAVYQDFDFISRKFLEFGPVSKSRASSCTLEAVFEKACLHSEGKPAAIFNSMYSVFFCFSLSCFYYIKDFSFVDPSLFVHDVPEPVYSCQSQGATQEEVAHVWYLWVLENGELQEDVSCF